MALELWRQRRPIRELARMEREMGDMFGRLFQDWPWAGLMERGGTSVPPVDMIDRPEEVVVRADLPGLEQKDVEVTIQEGMLTIRGERKEEREEKKEDEREEKKEGENYYYSERAFGAFVRSMPLPPGVDPEKVKATFKNGILEIHLQKSKELKGKKVEIKAE
jgi:HSP20 family protein